MFLKVSMIGVLLKYGKKSAHTNDTADRSVSKQVSGAQVLQLLDARGSDDDHGKDSDNEDYLSGKLKSSEEKSASDSNTVWIVYSQEPYIFQTCILRRPWSEQYGHFTGHQGSCFHVLIGILQ